MKDKDKKKFMLILEVLADHQHLVLSDKSNRQYIAGLIAKGMEQIDNDSD